MDELTLAQASVGRALERARAGEDRELAGAVRERGGQLAHVLAGLLKLSRVHAPDNRAFDAPAAELGRVLADLVGRLGPVHLVTVEDQVYVNDVRVGSDTRSGARDLGAELRRHEAGGLTFHAPLGDAAVRGLVAALSARAAEDAPRQALGQRLRAAGVDSVDPAGVFRFRVTGEREEGAGRTPEEIAARLLALATRAFGDLAAGRTLNPAPLRRAVTEALDAGIDAPGLWGPHPGGAAPAALHALEVSAVALATARAGGFGPGFLQDLGLAALLHDAGYLVPGAVGGAAGLLRHPVDGARLVLRQRGFGEGKLRRLRAVLEHHWDAGAGPSAAGAILRLADDYAGLVRVHGARVLRAELLGAMLRAAGGRYHPALAQLLVNALGRHPPGTLVELADGRRGRVAAPAATRERFERPLVRLLDAAGRPTPELVDLAGGGAVARAVPG